MGFIFPTNLRQTVHEVHKDLRNRNTLRLFPIPHHLHLLCMLSLDHLINSNSRKFLLISFIFMFNSQVHTHRTGFCAVLSLCWFHIFIIVCNSLLPIIWWAREQAFYFSCLYSQCLEYNSNQACMNNWEPWKRATQQLIVKLNEVIKTIQIDWLPCLGCKFQSLIFSFPIPISEEFPNKISSSNIILRTLLRYNSHTI